MKKNKMMRAASFLLVAVLLTTSVISGTFAKYVTSETATDSARVAKWGVQIITDGNMFGGAYKAVAGGNGVSISYSASEDSVHSAGGNVVAPGTEGTMASFVVSGQPEVDVKVTYDATLTLTGWTLAGSSEYCPLVFTVGTATYGTNDTAATNKYPTIAELITAVEGAIEANTKQYKALDNMTQINDDITVSWEWPFEGDDAKDTELGNLAIAPTVQLDVTCTITQID